ncbi:MAG: hypothetical protein J6W03_07115 [Bacteroidaceae bacterium]|nr:hypothetical protein [Bacteroidaceae bacterium]
MKPITTLIASLLLLCSVSLRAEVYTIDFNLGTVSGMSIKTSVAGVLPSKFCSAGADLFTLHTSTVRSYYNTNGCGIRIGSTNGKGIFIISLAEKKFISKVVVYASKIEENSELEFHTADGLQKVFDSEEMKGYSAASPASTDYRLPDVFVGAEIKDLKFQTNIGKSVVLHRIDIYTANDGSEDAVTAPAASLDEMGDFYNLVGQRIAKPLHGIYIRGGKKYIAR